MIDVVRLPIRFEEVIYVVFVVAPIPATKIVLRTAFIYNFFKSIEPERHHVMPRIGQLMLTLALFTNAFTTSVHLVEA